MRAAVRVAWRGAAMVAFGATAALAVALGRPASAPAALTTTVHQQPAHVCAVAGGRLEHARAGSVHCARAGPGHVGLAGRHGHPARGHARHHVAVKPT